MIKKRNINILKSYKNEIDMKTKSIIPKRGKGSKYSRKIKHKKLSIEYN